jgi:hypothetical protein
MPNWVEVVDAHAVAEPMRPFSVRGLDSAARLKLIDQTFAFNAQGYCFLADYDNRRIFVSRAIMHRKLDVANHVAYAAWIPTTLQSPLEVWEHPDLGPTSRNSAEPRLHYFSAYVGPDGATSHLVLAVAVDPRGPRLINSFSLTSLANADNKRYGKLRFVGYDPHSTPRMAKGAIPTYRIAPLP